MQRRPVVNVGGQKSEIPTDDELFFENAIINGGRIKGATDQGDVAFVGADSVAGDGYDAVVGGGTGLNLAGDGVLSGGAIGNNFGGIIRAKGGELGGAGGDLLIQGGFSFSSDGGNVLIDAGSSFSTANGIVKIADPLVGSTENVEIYGLKYPKIDGAGSGFFMMTDGAGNLSFQKALTVFVLTFDSDNARFFGELGLPTQQGWSEPNQQTDLVQESLNGVTKDVVRINDNTGSIWRTIYALDATDWINIQTYGFDYGGASRLDSVNGSDGFFSGLNANAAENPIDANNRRYGVFFMNNSGYLEVSNPDGASIATVMNGLGGNPRVLFDDWFEWNIVNTGGLGNAELYINGVLTTHIVPFSINTGGTSFGSSSILGSGSSGGIGRVTYHDNFGVTIFKEVSEKTLPKEALEFADIVNIITPEGRRDYKVIFEDASRGIGGTLQGVFSNKGGFVALETEDILNPKTLFQGENSFVVDVQKRGEIVATNTVEGSQNYILANLDDVQNEPAIRTSRYEFLADFIPAADYVVEVFTPSNIINEETDFITMSLVDGVIDVKRNGFLSGNLLANVSRTGGGTAEKIFIWVQFLDEASGNWVNIGRPVQRAIRNETQDEDTMELILNPIQTKSGDRYRIVTEVNNASEAVGFRTSIPDPLANHDTIPAWAVNLNLSPD